MKSITDESNHIARVGTIKNVLLKIKARKHGGLVRFLLMG